MADQSERHNGAGGGPAGVEGRPDLRRMLEEHPELAERARRARSAVRTRDGLAGDGMVSVEPDPSSWLEQASRGAGPGVVTYPGSVSIRWDSAVDFDVHPYDVTVTLAVDTEAQRMVCEDVRFTRRQGGPPIETTRLRTVKVTPLR